MISGLRDFHSLLRQLNIEEKNSELKIRVVKRNYIYYDELEMRQVQEMTYFTNLPKEEFEKRKIEDLYSNDGILKLRTKH